EYHGRVSLGKSQLDVTRNVRVAGGALDLADGALAVHGLLYMDQGGTVQLGRGQLRLGRSGLLVDGGGILLSTGDKAARIASTSPWPGRWTRPSPFARARPSRCARPSPSR